MLKKSLILLIVLSGIWGCSKKNKEEANSPAKGENKSGDKVEIFNAPSVKILSYGEGEKYLLRYNFNLNEKSTVDIIMKMKMGISMGKRAGGIRNTPTMVIRMESINDKIDKNNTLTIGLNLLVQSFLMQQISPLL
jgi:hypothetical protein